VCREPGPARGLTGGAVMTHPLARPVARRLRAIALSVAALAAISSPAAHADTTRVAAGLDLARARSVMQAAIAEAHRGANTGAFAIVDAGGHVVALDRLDRTFPAAATVAIEKARTAAVFRRPTKDFEDAIRAGRTPLLGVSVMTPLEGGVPIVIDGEVVGAIGVSGAASAAEDEKIARAAVSADNGAMPATAIAADVVYLPGANVESAFAKGVPLLETAAYKIHASRREAAGRAEVHTHDTDIIRVLQGRATFVTGGRMIGGEATAAEEIRGGSIEGGERRALAPGDVIVVPEGVPHWFADVQGPLLYYVVKVRTGGAR
jgi:glc operon protein GlcG